MPSSYIPRADGPFLEWTKNFYAYALAHFSAWQTVSPQITLEAPLASFTNAYAQCQTPQRTRVDIQNKDDAHAILDAKVRAYCNAHIRFNELVTDADRTSMGIPIPSGTRTPSPPPTSHPVVERIESALRQVTIHFHDEGSTKKAKPKGVHECEIRWGLLEAPPLSEDDIPHSGLDTRTPFTLTFHENQRGQKLYFCLRWIGPTDLKGPWSEIYDAIVP